MILTPIPDDRLPLALDHFAAMLDDEAARRVFRRLANPQQAIRADGKAAREHHAAALRILLDLGLKTRSGAPVDGLSWDGQAVRCETEAYVLLHEGAHFQLAAPERRHRPDFGLGPGPETGDRATAERAACLFGLAREQEEARASLLGILWEAELGQPALASFLDQNWLEGAGRRGTAAHFINVLAALRAGGFIAADGRPTRRLRQGPDRVPPQDNALCGPAKWIWTARQR